jgi:hypothetical protein
MYYKLLYSPYYVQSNLIIREYKLNSSYIYIRNMFMTNPYIYLIIKKLSLLFSITHTF